MIKIVDNTFMWRIIILLVIILFLINLVKSKKRSNEGFDNWTWYNYGFSGTTESSSTGTLMCAKNCCYSGWPASIDIDESAFGIKSGDMGTKFKATNLKCNNGFTTGCICDVL